MPVQKAVNKDFFKIWTKEMAYVLGFFAADGYVTINKRGGHFLCIQITDKELLEKIKKVMQSEHKIGIRLPRKKEEKIIYRIQIGSKAMCNDLLKLGFSERKTKSMAVPNVPNKYFSDFVRGYFDGDGNVWMGLVHRDRNKKVNTLFTAFTSCSYGFLSELKERLEKRRNIRCSSVLKIKNKKCYRLKLSILPSLKLYDFMYNNEAGYTSGLFLERKKKVFKKFKSLRP